MVSQEFEGVRGEVMWSFGARVWSGEPRLSSPVVARSGGDAMARDACLSVARMLTRVMSFQKPICVAAVNVSPLNH